MIQEKREFDEFLLEEKIFENEFKKIDQMSIKFNEKYSSQSGHLNYIDFLTKNEFELNPVFIKNALEFINNVPKTSNIYGFRLTNLYIVIILKNLLKNKLLAVDLNIIVNG